MEQNKLENQIKEQLSSRTIAPSPQAWDRLNAMLAADEASIGVLPPYKSNKKLGWLFIAASFIGFLFLGTYFFSQQNQVNEAIVVEKKRKIETSERIEIKKDGSLKTKNENEKAGLAENRIRESINKKVSSAEACQTPPKPVLNLKPESQIVNYDNLITEDKQIDNLKPEPQIAISVVVPTLRASGLKVDSSSLLSQVDNELTLTFREKAIKKYQTFKIAVADRNIQK